MSARLISIPDLPPVLPQGIAFFSFAEEVSVATPAASFNLVTVLPAGAIVVSAYLRLLTAISATTATKVGLGRVTSTADPDKYALSSNLTAQLVGGLQNFWANPLAAAETLGIFACDNAGAAAGSIGGAGQIVRAQITYAVPVALI